MSDFDWEMSDETLRRIRDSKTKSEPSAKGQQPQQMLFEWVEDSEEQQPQSPAKPPRWEDRPRPELSHKAKQELWEAYVDYLTAEKAIYRYVEITSGDSKLKN